MTSNSLCFITTEYDAVVRANYVRCNTHNLEAWTKPELERLHKKQKGDSVE